MSVQQNMDQINNIPVLSFKSQLTFEEWLEINFQDQKGIWLRFYKKDSGVLSINYDQALEAALCFGWIDGQIKKYDELSFVRKFTPRRKKSMWSNRNIRLVEKLVAEHRVKPSGLKEMNEAKLDGRWDRGYDSPSKMQIPDDFLSELKKFPEAMEFFQQLDKNNTYAIAWRLQTAQNEASRSKKFDEIIKMMQTGKKFH